MIPLHSVKNNSYRNPFFAKPRLPGVAVPWCSTVYELFKRRQRWPFTRYLVTHLRPEFGLVLNSLCNGSWSVCKNLWTLKVVKRQQSKLRSADLVICEVLTKLKMFPQVAKIIWVKYGRRRTWTVIGVCRAAFVFLASIRSCATLKLTICCTGTLHLKLCQQGPMHWLRKVEYKSRQKCLARFGKIIEQIIAKDSLWNCLRRADFVF